MRGKGEGMTHKKMGDFVKRLLLEMKFNPVVRDYAVHHQDSNSENEWLRRPQGVYHEWDVCGFTWFINQDTGEKTKFKYYVDIDGEWHGPKRQRNKDENADLALSEYYKKHPEKGHYMSIRLQKEMVLVAMKDDSYRDTLCLQLFPNLPGSPVSFLPHMVKELQEEKIRGDLQDDCCDDNPVDDGQPDEQKEWQDVEGIEQEMYPID
jgi:hypothetical protein